MNYMKNNRMIHVKNTMNPFENPVVFHCFLHFYHQVLGRRRSSSLPSIPYATSSLIDSANFSFDSRSDDHAMSYRLQSVIEKMTTYQSNIARNRQQHAFKE
jgi:hypothetical protein